MRVPTIVSWPGRLPTGVVNSGVTSLMDWFPTFVDLASVDTGELNPLDGRSIRESLLSGSDEELRDRSIAYYFAGKIGAYRSGDWKLKFPTVGALPFPARLLFAGANDIAVDTALYNLRDDIGEQVDLSEQYPEKVRELEAEIAQFQQDLGPLPPALDMGYEPLRIAPYYERPLKKVAVYSVVLLLILAGIIAGVAFLLGRKTAGYL